MELPIVISLCDLTGEAVKPWHKTHKCYIFDTQHETFGPMEHPYENIIKVPGRIQDNLKFIGELIGRGVDFVFGFPPCTDLAVSGAAHFEKKRQKNPHFQCEAVELFKLCEYIGIMSNAPYLIENPVSVVSTQYRKPDHSFHPYEYGGYLPKNDKNPISELILPRDAYPKKTCLWTGNGFRMPEKKPVKVPPGYSLQHKKLGGKSLKTKNIRSATPRGFSRAVYVEMGLQ